MISAAPRVRAPPARSHDCASYGARGVIRLQPAVFSDERGSFVKTYHRELIRECGLDFEPREQFFSTSHRDVIRGMHFQLPPVDHDKFVFCLRGAVLDAVLDLRKLSPTFRKFTTCELSETNRTCLYIPRGCAHGFLSLTEPSLVMYQTSTVHDPACDAGVRWDSFGLTWPCSLPVPFRARPRISGACHEFDLTFLIQREESQRQSLRAAERTCNGRRAVLWAGISPRRLASRVAGSSIVSCGRRGNSACWLDGRID